MPCTLEKFLRYIQPDEEMAIYEPQTTIKRFSPDAKDDFVEFLHITCTPQIKHFSLRRINVDAKFAQQYNKDRLAEKLWAKYGERLYSIVYYLYRGISSNESIER